MKDDDRRNRAQALIKTLLRRGYDEMKLGAEVGVHVNTIYRWRDGDSAPHKTLFDKLQQLAARTGP